VYSGKSISKFGGTGTGLIVEGDTFTLSFLVFLGLFCDGLK